jgi:DNA end-binding protein Ku
VSEEKVVDLMAALEASVAAAKESRKRHPSGRDDAEAEDANADAKAPASKARPAAKKRAARVKKSA